MAKKAEQAEMQEEVKVTTVKKKVATTKAENQTKTAPKTEPKAKPAPKAEVAPKLEGDTDGNGQISLAEDVASTKKYAWWAYILFFIPLLINSSSPFVRHHANEGLEINIFDFIGLTLLLVGVLVQTTNASVHFLMIIFALIGVGLLVLTTITRIYMIWATLKGKTATTPWMWNIRIIK